MQWDQIVRRIEEATARSAAGGYREAVELIAPCLQPLREEVARGGEGAGHARELLFPALNTAGIALYELRDLPSAMRAFQEALGLVSEGNMRAIGATLHEMARVACDSKDFVAAVELGKGAVRATTLADCEPVVAMQTLAVIYQHTGNFEQAEKLLRLARESCEARGDLIGLGMALPELGMLAAAGRNPDEAVAFLTKAIRVKRVCGNEMGLMTSLIQLHEVVHNNPETAGHPLLNSMRVM